MKKRFNYQKACFINLILVFMLIPSHTFCEDWPKKSEGYGPPFMGYTLDKTCGDFIRAKEKYIIGEPLDYYVFSYWARGFITGLNSSLENGGNVLGNGEPNFDDFLIIVENYCRENPTESFQNGIGVSLKKFSPVDWKGDKYKNE